MRVSQEIARRRLHLQAEVEKDKTNHSNHVDDGKKVAVSLSYGDPLTVKSDLTSVMSSTMARSFFRVFSSTSSSSTTGRKMSLESSETNVIVLGKGK